MSVFEFKSIGVVRTPFKDKFGIPRQPGMAAGAKGVIKLNADPDLKTALKTLDQFTHLWVVFVFHEHGGKSWKPSIRPPRLGGREKVGVLASRSPHRPNPIGISVVKIESINTEAPGGPEISVHGIDMLDGTPVLDIKPYLPYADSIPEAHGGWAHAPVPRHPVEFSEEAQKSLDKISLDDREKVLNLIRDVLELDPRPSFQKRQWPVDDPKTWGMAYGFDLEGYEVKYTISQQGFVVTDLYVI